MSMCLNEISPCVHGGGETKTGHLDKPGEYNVEGNCGGNETGLPFAGSPPMYERADPTRRGSSMPLIRKRVRGSLQGRSSTNLLKLDQCLLKLSALHHHFDL